MCSLSSDSAGHCGFCLSTISCHQTSRPAVQATSCFVRRTTRTFSIVLVCATASSAFFLRGTMLPLR